MTLDQYEKLLRSQNGKCAICFATRSKNGKALAVDHDHSTGLIRGLLCNECNTSLGLMQENSAALQRAIDYLNSKK